MGADFFKNLVWKAAGFKLLSLYYIVTYSKQNYLWYVYRRNFCQSFWRILYLLTIASFRIGVPSVLFFHQRTKASGADIYKNSVLNSSGCNEQRKPWLSLSKELKVPRHFIYNRPVGIGRAGGPMTSPVFGRSVNPISTEGADYAYQNTTDPQIF